jgi:hypothetical protein
MQPTNETEVPSNNNAPTPAAPVSNPKPPRIEEYEVKENIIFDLTDAELLKIAKTASLLTSQKREKANELKNKTDDLKEEIKGIEADIRFNLKLIEVGKQGRDVDCLKRIDFDRKIVQWLFAGVVMKERALESHETPRPQDNTTSSVNQ